MGTVSRRQFLHQSLAAGAAVGACPRIARADAPNSKLGVAVVGVRGRGQYLLSAFLADPRTRVAAIVEVDQAIGQNRQQAIAERQGWKPKLFRDMREAFADACISRQPQQLNCDAREGHLSAAACHLGDISDYLGEQNKVSIDEARRILADVNSLDDNLATLHRAVRRGRERKEAKPLPRIGIDEKAFRKGHDYVTVLYDLDNSTVEAISDGRDTEAGVACFSQLSTEQTASVEAVAMDMSSAYVKAAKQVIPLAEEKIVHDRFHVMQLVTKAVDEIRRAEHRRLVLEDDHRLAKTKYVWLTSDENLSEKQQGVLDRVFSLRLETGKAWGYKELLRDLWNHTDAASATAYFKDWYRRVIHTKLKPMKKVARTIKERLENVVSYCTHGITNGVAEGLNTVREITVQCFLAPRGRGQGEGSESASVISRTVLNSKIMSIKRRVGGFRNRENFKTAIFFYCGGLDLHPR